MYKRQQQGRAEELQESRANPALDVAATMYRLGTERSNVRSDSPELATAQRVTAEQQQDSHIGGPMEDVRSPLNMNELTKWDQANAALFSVLFLITLRPAGSLMSKFEPKIGKRANGQEAWRALLVKYKNNSKQRRRTLMRNCLLYTSPSPRD